MSLFNPNELITTTRTFIFVQVNGTSEPFLTLFLAATTNFSELTGVEAYLPFLFFSLLNLQRGLRHSE